MDAGRFPTTRWTRILESRDDTESRRALLHELLVSYWQPLYFYARRRGYDCDEARDVVQGFCAHLLEREFLENLDPAQGRLRAYLQTALANYIRDLRDKARRHKRGGDVTLVPLDFEIAENLLASAPVDAEQAYHRAWAAQIMERALRDLVAEYETGERSGPVELLRRLFGADPLPAYSDLAAEYGMSQAALKSFVHRARKRFRELVVAEVSETVHGPGAVMDETRALLELLG